MKGKHILICGPRGAGKSTLVEKLLRDCTIPVYGFFTRSTPRTADGFHSIYMHPAGTQDLIRSAENHVGDCNGRQRTVNTRVFTEIGVRLLEARKGGIIFMDELGFMETSSQPFCDAVMACLDGDIPVIATVKERRDVDFLNQVCDHPNTVLYYITEENRNMFYQELAVMVAHWNNHS